MKRSRRTTIDDELIELFRDDPEALAVVDAIAATQSAPAHRRHAPAKKFAVAVAAAIILLLLGVATFTRQSSQASVIDDALAALPTDRVIRLEVVDDATSGEVVNLKTGRISVLRHSLTEWYDPRTSRRRVRDQLAGVTVRDVLVGGSRVSTGGFAEQALSRFPAIYRSALLQAADSDVSPGHLAQQRVYWLRFRTEGPLRTVAVDRLTYKPLRAVFRNGTAVHSFRISDVSALGRRDVIPRPGRPSHLPKRSLSLRPATAADARAAGLVTLTAVTTTLGQPSQISITLSNHPSAGDFLFAHEPARGVLPTKFTRIQESLRPELRFGWSSPAVALSREPGTVFITHEGRFWAGFVTSPGRYFRIVTTAGRAQILRLARRLSAV